MTDKTTAEREAFEAWMNQQDQADPEPERTYELDEDGMNQLTKDCMLVAWQARASLPLPGAQEPVAPHGWLYDWTHSSATGRPDETYTGFTKDEQHARKHDNCTPVYTAPHPALSAGWVVVPVEPTEPMLDAVDEEVGGHCYSCSKWIASADDCRRVWSAMIAAAPPRSPSPSMDG